MSQSFVRKQPCNNCPYRIDAPLRHWSVAEFKDLLAKDRDQFGAVYGCHKKDGHVCVGWLMDQDNRRFPSISLRISLSKNSITRQYLDALTSKKGLYGSIEQMCKANYPEVFNKKSP